MIGIVAVLWSVAYIIWRVGWSWGDAEDGVTWWLAGPTFVLEVIGFACTALLVWATLTQPRLEPADQFVPALSSGDVPHDYDIAVIVGDRSADDLRSTLVALFAGNRSSQPGIAVIDHSCRTEIEMVADEFGVSWFAADNDPVGLKSSVACGDAEFVLMIAAGDIPELDAVANMSRWITGPSVAAVQGILVTLAMDSAEHNHRGRHDLEFERSVLNPALGSRGTAFLHGTGSLVRRSAVTAITLAHGPQDVALWALTPTLARAGMRVHASSGSPVVAVKPIMSPALVAVDRQRRCDAAWRLLNGPNGTLRTRGVPMRVRLASAVWAVRPLDGVRRIAIIVVVLAALLAGRPPFAVNGIAILSLWLPAFVLGSIAVVVLAGGSLRIGDRLRASLRHRVLALGLVAAINAVLVVRGISDRFTHAMREIDPTTQVILFAIVLWVLAGCLDSLRLLARRHDRRAGRVETSGTGFGGVWEEQPVAVLDLTMFGAGLLTTTAPELGVRGRLTIDVATESGVTSVETTTLVRNVREDVGGLWRIGLEFEDVSSYVKNTLAEACVVGPARSALGLAGAREMQGAAILAQPNFEVGGSGLSTASGTWPRGATVRSATLLALAGVVSSVAPFSDERLGSLPMQRLSIIAIAGLLAVSMMFGAAPSRLSRR